MIPSAANWSLRLLVSLVLVLLLVSGCRKYPDGPTFSVLSKKSRIVNNWKAERIFRNDIDRTNQFDSWTMNFTNDARLDWQYRATDSANAEVILADWELASSKEQIRLTLDERDPLSGQIQLLFIDILRLTRNEMRLRYLNEGNFFEVWLVPM